jgi:hypothetical protein
LIVTAFAGTPEIVGGAFAVGGVLRGLILI